VQASDEFEAVFDAGFFEAVVEVQDGFAVGGEDRGEGEMAAVMG
jgi:hypothetical protein